MHFLASLSTGYIPCALACRKRGEEARKQESRESKRRGDEKAKSVICGPLG
jgi:hypothetical protein